MIPLAGGGYLVDTPGFSEVGMWGVDPRELADCFPDFRPFLGDCRFADCRHRMEPDCRVREAVEGGAVAPDRYQSYLALLQELEAQPRDWE
jgi:ribosome biogenesis GTPase